MIFLQADLKDGAAIALYRSLGTFRSGSKADIARLPAHVHFTLESGPQSARLPTPYACQPGLPFGWQAGRAIIMRQFYEARRSYKVAPSL
jgi:hypothetical protein